MASGVVFWVWGFGLFGLGAVRVQGFRLVFGVEGSGFWSLWVRAVIGFRVRGFGFVVFIIPGCK